MEKPGYCYCEASQNRLIMKIINKMKEEDKFRPKGVILDMDGLMLETERPLIPLWLQAGKHFGWDIKYETVINAIGKTGNDVRQLCMRDLGQDFPYDEFHDELGRLVILELEKGIALRPGLIFLLDRLSSMNMPFAVATSTQRKWAVWKLGIAGIGDRFSVMVCGDEVARKKPFPDIYLAAAEKLGLLPSECVGFEDSPAGLESLCAAGIRSVFVKDMVEPSEEVLSTVWRRYKDLAEAAEVIK